MPTKIHTISPCFPCFPCSRPPIRISLTSATENTCDTRTLTHRPNPQLQTLLPRPHLLPQLVLPRQLLRQRTIHSLRPIPMFHQPVMHDKSKRISILLAVQVAHKVDLGSVQEVSHRLREERVVVPERLVLIVRSDVRVGLIVALAVPLGRGCAVSTLRTLSVMQPW
jgi:hypothetical protein